MKQSKESILIFNRGLCYAYPLGISVLYLIIVLLGTVLRFFQKGHWSITDYDAHVRYASSIDSEIITDWDNPLILQISLVIKHAFTFLFHRNVAGIEIINASVAFSLAVVAIFLSFLLFYLTNKHKIYSLCIFPFSLFSFYPAPLYWSNSAFFTSLLFIAPVLVIAYIKSKKRIWKILSFVSVIFILVLAIDCRRNSILIVPVLLYWTLSNCHALKIISKAFLALIISLFLYAFTTIGVSHLIEVKRTHPTAPMLISDMMIACALENRLEDYSNPYVLYPDNIPCCDRNHLRAYCWPYSIQHLTRENIFEIEKRYGQDWHSWETFSKFYIQEWINHPKAMATAKMIQVIQFYTGFYIPDSIKSVITDSFPALKETRPDALNNAVEPFYRMAVRLGTLILMSVIPVYIFCYKRSAIAHPNAYQISFYLSIISFIYACSFVVVTPTVHERYLLPSIIIASVVAPVFVLTQILEFYNKNKKKC